MPALSRIENHPDPQTLKRLQHTMADCKHLQNIEKDDEWHDVHGHPAASGPPAQGPQGGMEMPQHPTHSVPDAPPLDSSAVSSSTSQMKSSMSVSKATETDWERVSHPSVGIPEPLDDDYQAMETDLGKAFHSRRSVYSIGWSQEPREHLDIRKLPAASRRLPAS